jgi:hypothetical protein
MLCLELEAKSYAKLRSNKNLYYWRYAILENEEAKKGMILKRYVLLSAFQLVSNEFQ